MATETTDRAARTYWCEWCGDPMAARDAHDETVHEVVVLLHQHVRTGPELVTDLLAELDTLTRADGVDEATARDVRGRAHQVAERLATLAEDGSEDGYVFDQGEELDQVGDLFAELGYVAGSSDGDYLVTTAAPEVE